MAVGSFMLAAGAIWYFFGHKLHWLGNLPGDIHVERPNFRFYFPLTTMVLLSILLNVAIRLLRKFF